MFVIRELAFDQQRDDLRVADPEDDVGVLGADDDLDLFFQVGQDARYFQHAAARDDHLHVAVDAGVSLEVLDGQTVPVGGGKDYFVGLDGQADAGQDGAAVVGGRGNDREINHFLQEPRGDLERGAGVGGRDGRKVLGGYALESRAVAAAGDGKLQCVLIEAQLDRLGAELADELGYLARRDGDRALGFHLASDQDRGGDLHVGGGELEHGVLGCDQNVGKHW